MNIIFINKEIGKSKYSYLAQSFVVSVAFILMLTVASVTYSAYRSELTHKRITPSLPVVKHTTTQKSSTGKDRSNKLALRIKALQVRANRLNKAGKRLVKRKPKGDFSVAWDRVIAGQKSKASPIVAKNTRKALRRFRRHDDAAKVKRSIQIVSKSLLRKYRSRSTSLPAGWPLKQGRVSSKFGKRGRRMHRGLDIAARRGTPVLAVEDGVVTRSKYVRGYGRLVVLKHSNMYTTRYGHNSKNLVKVGDKVYKGQTIALVGSTGRSTGPHIHFEIRQNGTAINPLKYLGAMAYFSLAENVKLSKYVKLSKK